MEYALLIEDVKEYRGKSLSAYHLCMGDKRNGLTDADRYYKQFVNEELSFLYFGNEFCEYRLPSAEQLRRLSELCFKEDLTPFFVTPPVTDYGLEIIEQLMDIVFCEKLLSDVVVNDVGVMTLIHRKYPGINLIAGRILDKTSHDSRATSSELEMYYGENGIKYAMTPGVVSRPSLTVFQEYGVTRFEFDLPKVGLMLPDYIGCSLYWPYSYLTTGRVCLFHSMVSDARQTHLVGNHDCNQLCRKYQIEKRKPINGLVTDNGQKISELFLFQKGNTIFYVNDIKDEKQFSSRLEQFDRLIIQS